MFWADRLLEDRKVNEWINDAWTPSGMVHMGSMKGPVMHDVLFRILKERGIGVKFTYGFDDADPLDGLPTDLKQTHEKYMGIPIYLVPSPDGNGSFADYFGNKLRKILKELGINGEIYKTSDLYKDGTFDNAIKFVLDHVKDVRRVYEEIYKKTLGDDWYPLQVVCPNCGKLGTTKVIGWDGKEVEFVCKSDLVIWAKGCGTIGKMSPFKGNSKMPFKVEWASKWWIFGVTIEGAGKDHASAGGTYDVAMRIITDVFKVKPPFKFSYEFFLSGGKKMASSKGVGLNGEQLLEILAPELVRFLMIKNPPSRAVEFTPLGTDLIPRLYDEYEEYAQIYFDAVKNKSLEDNEKAKIFKYSQINEIKHPPKVKFSILSQWVQMPNMAGEIKKNGLNEWVPFAKVWLEKYAPEDKKFHVQNELPKEAQDLSEKQKEVLGKIAEEVDKTWDPEEFQTKIYEIGKELGLSGKETFAAIYLSLIGKDHGPKAAWLILSLDKEFIKKRFNAA
ncbi:MAG: lysine--tRNA ligase [Patescibacteria group bacterium]